MFTCESRAVRVLAPQEELAVVLTAGRYQDHYVRLLGRHEERPFLRLNWPDARYPWIDYVVRQKTLTAVTPELLNAFLKLRRILVRFRAEGYSDIARHADMIENPVVAGSGLARNLLDFCLDRGLVRRQRPWYTLDRHTMDQLGIHWTDIRERNISPAIAMFLEEFIRSHS